MESLIPTNEYTEVDGRAYANPQVALDESNSFIDNLRATQGQQNQEITKQTQNLGTSVPTSLGGLTGAESYFTSRYQTPQTNTAVANLRATAQAAALNQALQNEQEIWKKKYNDAYRKYQKSAYDKANQPTTQSPDYSDLLKKLGVDVNPDDNNNDVSMFEGGSGVVTPSTNTSSKYQDPVTGKWFMLTSPKEIDAIAISNSIAGRNPKDGMTTRVNGKTFRYDAGSDMWYQQTYIFGQE